MRATPLCGLISHYKCPTERHWCGWALIKDAFHEGHPGLSKTELFGEHKEKLLI